MFPQGPLATLFTVTPKTATPSPAQEVWGCRDLGVLHWGMAAVAITPVTSGSHKPSLVHAQVQA